MDHVHPVSTAVEKISNIIPQAEHDFVWGAAAIGAAIGRTPRQTHHLLSTGEIKSARKKGGRWVASRTALLRELGGA
jgi:hypothetical protein